MKKNCDLGVIQKPCCTSQPGPEGPAGSNGVSILENDITDSIVVTKDTWQDLYPTKQYSVNKDLLSIHDRLCVEVVGEIVCSESVTMAAIKILFDGKTVYSHTVLKGESRSYFKIKATIDISDETTENPNVFTHGECFSSSSDTLNFPVSAQTVIQKSAFVVDYATTPDKLIKVQGVIYGYDPDENNYCKINQLYVDYSKIQ